jgi:hypothetical protein
MVGGGVEAVQEVVKKEFKNQGTTQENKNQCFQKQKDV